MSSKNKNKQKTEEKKVEAVQAEAAKTEVVEVGSEPQVPQVPSIDEAYGLVTHALNAVSAELEVNANRESVIALTDAQKALRNALRNLQFLGVVSSAKEKSSKEIR